jgi:hypothetical protein
MSSLATAGTPDLWLSGNKDLWLEVKWDETTKGPIKPKLSALQLQWCNNRSDDGREVMVIVGTAPSEAILYVNTGQEYEWQAYSNIRRPLKEIITDILELVI